MSRSLSDAVQWHEGMLLTPQHFQQSDRRHEELVFYHALALGPFHWGVRRVEVDTGLLQQQGLFRVTELEAVMPDGLPVFHPAGDGEPLELRMDVHAAELAKQPLTVHLAIARRRGTSDLRAGSLDRYTSVLGEGVADENTGENGVDIPRLRPKLSLIAGDTPGDKYVSFPIGRVAFRDERYLLLESFSPPMLALSSGSPLGRDCARVAERVREKAIYLSERVRAHASTQKPMRILEMQTSVQRLGAALPPLEAVLGTGAAHPFTVYTALCGLAGQIAGIGPGLVPPQFRAYNHAEVRASFEPVLEFCNRVLDGIQEAYSILPLHFEEGTFRIKLDRGWAGKTVVLGALPPSGGSESAVAGWMESALIGSPSRMASIRDRRIRGAPRQRVERPADLNLSPSKGTVVFAVKVEQDFVEPEEGLELLNPADPLGQTRPGEIVMYVRYKS